jgi:hypothetical protein
MKILKNIFLALSFLPILGTAADLSPKEEKELSEQVGSIFIAYENDDVDKIVKMTIKPIVTMSGGTEAMKSMIYKSLNAQKNAGISIESTSIGKPTEPIVAGDDIFTFIPKITIMKSPGKRVKSTSFMIASRGINDKDWYFMDASGLRKNPGMLYVIFPKLPKDIVLPSNNIEFIQ